MQLAGVIISVDVVLIAMQPVSLGLNGAFLFLVSARRVLFALQWFCSQTSSIGLAVLLLCGGLVFPSDYPSSITSSHTDPGASVLLNFVHVHAAVVIPLGFAHVAASICRMVNTVIRGVCVCVLCVHSGPLAVLAGSGLEGRWRWTCFGLSTCTCPPKGV
jgi:hypothetical protein